MSSECQSSAKEYSQADGNQSCRCARHEKAVSRLLKSSFAGGKHDHPPAALIEQRRALLTAVIAARERRSRSGSIDSISSASTSTSSFMLWHSSSDSTASSSGDSDCGSDGAVEDDTMAMSVKPANITFGSLPRRGAPRLPTVVESDEECEAGTPTTAACSRMCV